MIELPEGLTLSKQLNSNVVGKTVKRVLPPTKMHRFCWFSGDPLDYGKRICTQKVVSATSFGMFVEMSFENGLQLCINDGVNIRLTTQNGIPKDYQLLIEFTDESYLVFTVAMYGGIVLHDVNYDNEYYVKSVNAVSPFSNEFADYYYDTLAKTKADLVAKAFLATEQRFAGLGNGVLQDILFDAQINPKRRMSTLDGEEREALLKSIVSVLKRMTDSGGRNTEKDLFGNYGGYITKMSKNTLLSGCSACGGAITKEAYMGGSVYYCSNCQPLIKQILV